MKKRRRQAISFLLSLLLVLSVSTSTAFAAQNGNQQTDIASHQQEETQQETTTSLQSQTDAATMQQETEAALQDQTETVDAQQEAEAVLQSQANEEEETTASQQEPTATTQSQTANTTEQTDHIQQGQQTDTTKQDEAKQTTTTEQTNVASQTTVQTITAFKEPQNTALEYTTKPALSQLIEEMPTTIDVYLNGEQQLTTIPVTWETEQSYETTDESYYLFYAAWDESNYVLDEGYDKEGYIPFVEVLIGLNGTDTIAASGIENIISRAYHQVNINWKPKQDVNGYTHSNGKQEEAYYAGRIYAGMPYGQQVDSGLYVPHDASFQTFLNAVKNQTSIFYTKRGSYDTRNSVYYASDCSAFVTYSYDLPRMTTSMISSSKMFDKVKDNSVYNAKVGDCFNRANYHVELITGMNYDKNGALISVEVSEQTPPKARTIIYTPSRLQSMIDNGGYTLLRYQYTSNVSESDHYTGCVDDNDFLEKKADLGTNFYAYFMNMNDWTCVTNSTNVLAKIKKNAVNQMWYFEKQSDGSYKITSCKDGTCLQTASQSLQTTVSTGKWTGSDNQKWYIYGASGKYKIQTINGEGVLALADGSGKTDSSLTTVAYQGYETQLFHILKANKIGNVRDASLTLGEVTYGSNGQVNIESTIVKLGTTKLVENTDYKVTYETDIKASTVKMTVKGIGTYTGLITKTFPLRETSATLSATTYTYNGKQKTPKVTVTDKYGAVLDASNYEVTYPKKRTDVGKYSVTIKVRGQSYTETYKKAFKIIPAKVTLTSLKSTASKTMTAKWTQNKMTTGYEIWYTKNKNFTTKAKAYVKNNATCSKKIKTSYGNRTYYAKVRCYQVVNGVKYYSKWSNIKTIKVKK